MHLVLSTGKHASGVKRGKTCIWCQARENMHLVSSARKQATATGVKRGKTCIWCQARENRQLQLVSSAGKLATGVKRRKTCIWCQAWGNMQPVPNAGRDVSCAECGKMTCNKCRRGKTWNWRQKRQLWENTQQVPNAGKFAIGFDFFCVFLCTKGDMSGGF